MPNTWSMVDVACVWGTYVWPVWRPYGYRGLVRNLCAVCGVRAETGRSVMGIWNSIANDNAHYGGRAWRKVVGGHTIVRWGGGRGEPTTNPS